MSTVTVARVLRSDATYRRPSFAARAERIRALAAELGYRPNSAARAVATGRFGSVALVFYAGTGFFPFELVSGACAELAAGDLQLTLADIGPDQLAAVARAPKPLRELCVDGLLVHFSHDIPIATAEVLRRAGLPTVWMNALLSHDAVYPDEDEAARRLTRSLIDVGPRRIVYLSTLHGWSDLAGSVHYSVHARPAGCQAVCAQAGCHATVVRPERGTDDAAAARTLADGLLAAAERPTAIIAFRRTEAEAVYAAAAARGLRVPDDLVVATWLNDQPTDLGLPLVAAPVPFAAVARAAASALRTKLQGGASPAPAVAVPFGPLIGRVTGPSRAG